MRGAPVLGGRLHHRKQGHTMRRPAPPLEAIETFIVATRSESFREAAETLALSPSAISRRIQALEAHLGAELFQRVAPTPTLTAIGEHYHREVAPAIDAIRAATFALASWTQTEPLTVVAPQSFAMGWLLPRLPGFLRDHPDQQISLRVGWTLDDLRQGAADLAILPDAPDSDGLPAEPLAALDGVLATAPQMADGRTPPRGLSDLSSFPRLTVYRPKGIWETWLGHAGYRGPDLPDPTRFDSLFVMYEAAAAGLGVAICSPFLAERFLQERRLVPCFEHLCPLGLSYSLVFAGPTVRRAPQTRAFVRWLRAEVGRTRGARLEA